MLDGELGPPSCPARRGGPAQPRWQPRLHRCEARPTTEQDRLLLRIPRVPELAVRVAPTALLRSTPQPVLTTNLAAGRHRRLRCRARCCHPVLPGNAAGGRGWRHAAARPQPPPRPTPTEYGRLGAGICRATSACRLLDFMGRHCPRTAQTPTECTRRPLPALRRLLSANLGETAGGRCSGTRPAPRTTRPAPGGRPGWQRAVSKALDKRARDALVDDAASCAFTALPSSADTWVPDAEYRVTQTPPAPPARPEALSLRRTLA